LAHHGHPNSHRRAALTFQEEPDSPGQEADCHPRSSSDVVGQIWVDPLALQFLVSQNGAIDGAPFGNYNRAPWRCPGLVPHPTSVPPCVHEKSSRQVRADWRPSCAPSALLSRRQVLALSRFWASLSSRLCLFILLSLFYHYLRNRALVLRSLSIV